MAVYTRRGDDGTSTTGRGRVYKDCQSMEVVGEVDELSSLLAAICAKYPDVREYIEEVLRELYRLNAYIATGGKIDPKLRPERLEREIDSMWEELPPLNRFILLFTDPAAAEIHHARAVCRRVERRLVTLAKSEDIEKSVLAYMNRLSDYLFTLARWINHKHRGTEILT